jgi:hypothetical protein
MHKERFHILVIMSVIMALALTSALAAQGQGIQNPWSVKIFGGGWSSSNGDVRTFLLAYDRFYQQWAEAYGYTKTGSLDWPGAGGAIGGEIARQFSSRISAGLAVERLAKSHSGFFELGSGGSDRMEMTMTAVSVAAFGRYALPVTKSVSVSLTAGFGPLFGSLDQTHDSRLEGEGVLVNGRFNAMGFTAQTDLGLEWKLGSMLALHLEGGYRLASLPDWSGEDVHDWGDGSARHSGSLYYVDMQIDTERVPSVYYPGLILEDPLLGTRVVDYRKFKADFTGFCFRLGLCFRFGL